MFKTIKNFVFIIPAMIVMLGAATGILGNVPQFPKISYPQFMEESETTEPAGECETTKTDKEAKKIQAMQIDTKQPKATSPSSSAITPSGKPADGIFVGEAVCEVFYYTLQLRVQFRDGKAVSISNLKIIGNSDPANRDYWEKAWRPMVSRILKEQNTEVDSVSGATYSSNAIKEAYLDALRKAINRNDGKSEEDKKSPKKTGKPEKKKPEKITFPEGEGTVPEGTIADGTYRVTSECVPDEDEAFEKYMLTADVKFADGKLVSISNYTSTDETNRIYYMKAANGNKTSAGVASQLIVGQSASGINAVSGATCSSKTIVQIYLNALTQATGVEQTVENETTGKSITEETAESETTSKETEEEESGETLYYIKDGIYTVSTTVFADEEWEFDDYEMSANVIFQNGLATAVENVVISDKTNQWYCTRAMNGTRVYPGMITQFLEKQSVKLDVVSGATCSSNAFIEIFRQAIEMAKTEEIPSYAMKPEETTGYMSAQEEETAGQ